MIGTIKNKIAQDLYDGVNSKESRRVPYYLHNKIGRLLDQINSIKYVESLSSPPGNRLEKLRGNYKNYWCLRINLQWRIIFTWDDGVANNIEVIDYHR